MNEKLLPKNSFMDALIRRLGSDTKELKRQVDFFKAECPLILENMASECHFLKVVSTNDPIEMARAEGERKAFLRILELIELPPLYFERYLREHK